MPYQKPKGTRDLYGRELCRNEMINQAARNFFIRQGYMEIRTPTFENADLFIRSIGEHTDIVEKENYTFKSSKKTYMLRPEGTASALRALIENNIPLPARLLYIEPMFRKEKPQKGRYREFWQIGIELIGESDPIYDAEMIDHGNRFLTMTGARDFTIEINSIGCPDCRQSFKRKIMKELKPHIAKLCKDCQRRLNRNFMRIFDCKKDSCQSIYDNISKISNNLCQPCSEHYTQVKDYLNVFRVEFTENEKLVRGLDYYTRTVFEFKISNLGARNTVLAGGRYDLLMKELGGDDTPALGWAMGVDCLLLTLPEHIPEMKIPTSFFVATIGKQYLQNTLQLKDVVNKHSYICIMGNPEHTIKAQLKRANRLNVNYTLIFGEDEAKDESCAVKNMETGKQEKVLLDNLDSYISGLE